jgi:hypothetical protein
MKAATATILAIAVVVAVALLASRDVESSPIYVAHDVTSAMTGLASGAAGSFDVTCGTTATAISGMSGFNDVACYTVSATSVFIGNSAVTASGFCVSTNASNCGSNGFSASMDAGAAFCRVASGTVTLSCMGLK